jgi:hypothetical protein
VAILKKANVLGIPRITQGMRKKADVSILLHDNPISYYWLGFLMADGSFTDRRIHLGVAGKDLDHLKSFLKFVNSTNKIQKLKDEDHYRIKLTSVKEVQALKEKFHISNRKTYEPCNLKEIKDSDLLFSLIIGYIDGDGSVTKQGNGFSIYVVAHPCWVDNLTYMKSFLHSYSNDETPHSSAKVIVNMTSLPQDPTKTKKPYQIAYFKINRKSLLLAIKKKAGELHLPFLERKLGKIT